MKLTLLWSKNKYRKVKMSKIKKSKTIMILISKDRLIENETLWNGKSLSPSLSLLFFTLILIFCFRHFYFRYFYLSTSHSFDIFAVRYIYGSIYLSFDIFTCQHLMFRYFYFRHFYLSIFDFRYFYCSTFFLSIKVGFTIANFGTIYVFSTNRT